MYEGKKKNKDLSDKRIVFVTIVIFLVLTSILIILLVKNNIYYFSGFEGKVINYNTGKPIEGVPIFYEFQKNVFNLAGGDIISIKENFIKTNEQGVFKIPSFKKFVLFKEDILGVTIRVNFEYSKYPEYKKNEFYEEDKIFKLNNTLDFNNVPIIPEGGLIKLKKIK